MHAHAPVDFSFGWYIKWPCLFEVTMAVRAEQQHNSQRRRERGKTTITGMGTTGRG